MDYFKKHNAEAMARRVSAWWASRGYLVNARAQPVYKRRPLDDPDTTWAVVSDMVNGFPPGLTVKQRNELVASFKHAPAYSHSL
jgi:hypothetical protein